MKKLLIGAAAVAAAAMLTACESSSESSSSIGSCDVSYSMSMMGMTISSHMCAESSNLAAIQADCDSAKAMYENPPTDDYGFDLGGAVSGSAKYGSGCPSGYVNRCTDEDGTTLYYYDSGARGVSCEELLADEEDEDDYGFTPADDEYYMKALKKAAKK